MMGIATFIANMFILAIAVILWLVAIADVFLLIKRVSEVIKEYRC
jgi:hypothetical protein